MLPKKNRLTKENFKYVYNKSKAFHNDFFVLLLHLNDKSVSPQVGIVIGKKVGKASARNKVKRRIREIFRKNLHKLPSKAQIILICKKEILKLEFAQLEEEILNSLKKGKLL